MSQALVRSFGHLTRTLLGARRWVILAMLLSLHAGLMAPVGGDYQRIWLLVHFGLFLIWQPFISAERELNIAAVLLLLGITGIAFWSLAGWVLVMWVAILIGIMGGKVFTQEAAQRSRFYLLAVFFLFTLLLTWTVPVSLLGIRPPAELGVLVTLVLPLLLLGMAFLPFRADDEARSQVFDFFYSIFVFQLVVVVVLGTIAAMRIANNQYFQAVILTVLAFGCALFVLAVMWGPRSGFGGLRSYFSRYLMTVGMPFELWMRRIAELSESEASSQRFIEEAMAEVARLPWIVGSEWTSADGRGSFGKQTSHAAHFRYHELDVTFFTDFDLSPALFLHLRLLAQVVGEFYEGKRRELVLKQNAYMQAVHETGARLTHDIKNLLQSLYALTSAGVTAAESTSEHTERREPTPYDQMLRRQLPQLTKRLQTTLDKLQNPAVHTKGLSMPAPEWWDEVQVRYRDIVTSFISNGELTDELPATLFDTVLENCLENARRKSEREPGISIEVTFATQPTPNLTITDTGNAVPTGAAEALFRLPAVHARRGGLGIGLYQAFRQAQQLGYVLRLANNEAGCVRFVLERAR